MVCIMSIGLFCTTNSMFYIELLKLLCVGEKVWNITHCLKNISEYPITYLKAKNDFQWMNYGTLKVWFSNNVCQNYIITSEWA